jgi:hypothetical protein
VFSNPAVSLTCTRLISGLENVSCLQAKWKLLTCSIYSGHPLEDRLLSRSQITENKADAPVGWAAASGASGGHRNWRLRKAYVRWWASAAASAL